MDTSLEIDVTKAGRELPWRLRRLAPGERLARERIAAAIPGGSPGFGLESLATLLGTGEIRARPAGITRAPAPIGDQIIPLALSSRADVGSKRAVLGLGRRLASTAVDLALGRSPGGPEPSPGAKLAPGEQGALLYTLDRAAGDWISHGGAPFVVRGILTDGEQVIDYLGGPPDWQVSARLTGDELCDEIWLWFTDPVPGALGSPDPEVSIETAAELTAVTSISIGSSRVTCSSLERLAPGDLLLLDEWSHPDHKGDTVFPIVSCGRWNLRGVWRDARRIEISTDQERGYEMDTKSSYSDETPVALETPSARGVDEMEVLVRAEVGEVRLTVKQAAGLVPGRVLVLDREVGPEVFLKVGDKLLGRGELIEHEGSLAVEVTEVP